MNYVLRITLIVCCALSIAHAQTTDKTLPSFDKVIVSPLVSIILVAGEQESVRLEYENVTPEKVNCFVQDKTLRIYLDDAKITVKQQKWEDGNHSYKKPIYGKGVKVTAYVTYRQLSELEVRGEEEAICQSEITGDVFKLRVYGQATVTLSSLKVNELKASIYGENKITIQSGQADEQLYRVYGESQIEAENLVGQNVSTSLYGDSKLRLYASNRIGVTAVGESDVTYSGGAHLHKGIVLGDVTIRKTE
ncbi:head GIN domain-containing protein [Spirosoma soli]|uniref:Head GIN domain-containing protein n=1 Tax=Spirosoma soli TaxID=1770529 RepID=A0ABW5M3Z5_9BACT